MASALNNFSGAGVTGERADDHFLPAFDFHLKPFFGAVTGTVSAVSLLGHNPFNAGFLGGLEKLDTVHGKSFA
jgi:hypothetical protein